MKRIIITGASSGLGYHLTSNLLERGYAVFAGVRDPGVLEELSQKFDRLTVLKLDITSYKDILNFKNYFETEKIFPDVLINNAGYAEIAPIETVSAENFQKQFETNVFGLIKLTQKIVPLMKQNGGGKIISTGSSAAKIATPFNAVYASTKHALSALTEGLRYELYPFDIQVTQLLFGKLDTKYNEKVKDKLENLLDSSLNRDYFPYLKAFLSSHTSSNGTSLEMITRRLMKIIESKKLKAYYTFDAYTSLLFFIKNCLPSFVYDTLLKQKIKRKR